MIQHIQLPQGQLVVLLDRDIPLHRMFILSCRLDKPLTFTSDGAVLFL